MSIAAEQSACSDWETSAGRVVTLPRQQNIGPQQGHCLNGHPRENRLKILIKDWLLFAKMFSSNTETVWPSSQLLMYRLCPWMIYLLQWVEARTNQIWEMK
jgi:hypothetical protein